MQPPSGQGLVCNTLQLPQLVALLAPHLIHCTRPLAALCLAHDVRFYLDCLFFDTAVYSPEELGFVTDTAGHASHHVSPGAAMAKGVGTHYIAKHLLGLTMIHYHVTNSQLTQ